jgi:hypothetical protein
LRRPAAGARSDRRFEDVPRALDVDVARLSAGLHDDEGQMHHDVSAIDEALHRRAIEDIATAVLGALPAVDLRIERSPRHADYPLDLVRALEGADERPPEVAGRAGDRDGQAGH